MTDSTPTIVAIDGPAGSGKSSVSKEVARQLGFGFLDTGAVYRAITWLTLDRRVESDDAVVAAMSDAAVALSLDPDDFWVTIDGAVVTADIREPRVSDVVSRVARIPAVRAAVNEFFRALARDSDRSGVVIEGRDITTVVVPDAPVRVLLTASPEVRARRRSAELVTADAASVAASLHRRDAADSQVSEFLEAAPGVDVVDSTELDFAQTVAAVLSVVHTRTGGRHGR